MNKKDLICIVCPLGCNITIKENKDGYEINGNKCPRGKDYSIKEMTNPTRIIPTTVKIKNAKFPRLPVKTSKAVPKKDIFKIMKIINCVEVNAPIKIGDIIIENILELNVDIVATRNLRKVGDNL